jgi:hypothetical protein
MKRLFLVLVAVAALTPVAAFAGTSQSTTRAHADCAQLRAAMGQSAFSQAYPTFGACVASYAPVEQKVDTSAQATCTAQQSDATFPVTHDGKTFDQYYGTPSGKSGKSGNDAFGKCVSTVTKSNVKVEQQGRLNPAQTCKSLRTQLGTATFDQTYGKNANDRNAFGKCVSATAKSQVDNEVNASKTCSADQSDPTFATTHNGETFAQFYGTNTDGSNAFGNCVSSTAKAASNGQAQATERAALSCKSQQKADPSGFKAKYKTFGRCVSTETKSQ